VILEENQAFKEEKPDTESGNQGCILGRIGKQTALD